LARTIFKFSGNQFPSRGQPTAWTGIKDSSAE